MVYPHIVGIAGTLEKPLYPKDFAKILKTDDTFSTESDKFRHKRENFMFFVKKTLKRNIKKWGKTIANRLLKMTNSYQLRDK